VPTGNPYFGRLEPGAGIELAKEVYNNGVTGLMTTEENVPLAVATSRRSNGTSKGPGGLVTINPTKGNTMRVKCRSYVGYIDVNPSGAATNPGLPVLYNATGTLQVPLNQSTVNGDCNGIFPICAGDLPGSPISTYYRQDFFFNSNMLSSVLSGYYEFYIPRKLTIEYSTVCPTSTPGSIAMAWVPIDISEFRGDTPYFPYTNAYRTMSASPAFVETPLYKACRMTVAPMASGIAGNENNFLRCHMLESAQGSVDQTRTIECFAGCLVFKIASHDVDVAPIPLGHLHIEVEFEFKGVKASPAVSYGYMSPSPLITQLHQLQRHFESRTKNDKDHLPVWRADKRTTEVKNPHLPPLIDLVDLREDVLDGYELPGVSRRNVSLEIQTQNVPLMPPHATQGTLALSYMTTPEPGSRSRSPSVR